ncbi:3193_t:CDS:2 [Ambispora gerdemannii]|uniref:3193_t:CDS:1 n=1 Tax=Ambispora gerdemannii TaxID=144530 RepID=A0A9N8YKF4_9GLOM|nr:3193_t:CDS:2 [Ambispora gerdemannii]
MQPKIQDTEDKKTVEMQSEKLLNYMQESTSLFLRNSNDYSLQDIEIKNTAGPQIDEQLIHDLKDALEANLRQTQSLSSSLEDSKIKVNELTQQCTILQQALGERKITKDKNNLLSDNYLSFAPLNYDTPIINHRTEYDRDENIHNHASEIEQLREENERLKLELLAYKKNTRPLGKSFKATKLDETRNNIKKDKLYYKLQLGRVDNFDETKLAELIKEIMLILEVNDVDRIIPSIEQVDKVTRLVPQLCDFINKVVDTVLYEQDEEDHRVKNYNKANSAVGAGSSIPPEQKLCATIETILQWRDTVKEMENIISHFLQKGWSKQQNTARR